MLVTDFVVSEKTELAKRIWHILIDVDNVNVNIRRDFPVNSSLFVCLHKWVLSPSGCCCNEVKEDMVTFQLLNLSPHVTILGDKELNVGPRVQ